MRLILLGRPVLTTIMVLALTVVRTTPGLAQTGQSIAWVYDNVAGSYGCYESGSGAVSSANCPPTPVTSGVGSANSAQDGVARTLSSNVTLNQTELGMSARTSGYSDQHNQFNVIGTSGSSDQLVFHLLTTGPYATGAGGVGQSSWGLGYVVVGGTTGGGSAYVYAYGDGSTYSYSSGQAGPGFLDFAVPFSSFTGQYNYSWFGWGDTNGVYGEPVGLSLSGGFSGTLGAIYATNAEGQTYASVDFTTGELDVSAAAIPEPASMALLGTGLVGVFSAVRRRRKKSPQV